MSALDTGLVKYSTAEELARTFHEATGRIRILLNELGERTSQLKEKFFDSGYHFGVSLGHGGDNHISPNAEGINKIIDGMKREAWQAIINKLEIRRLMSSARQKEMDEQLSGQRRYNGHGDKPIPPVPDITPESILSVLNGFISESDNFLAEAIREEYDAWKPHKGWSDNFKTNAKFGEGGFVLGRKIIKGWMVERNYSGKGYSPRYQNRGHIQSLDNIFHLLDGKGFVKGNYGPLEQALRDSENGVGETEYFKFKAFKNGNLHLEFKRIDLLDRFNQIAGQNRLRSPENN
jgi:hypothetical protein